MAGMLLPVVSWLGDRLLPWPNAIPLIVFDSWRLRGGCAEFRLLSTGYCSESVLSWDKLIRDRAWGRNEKRFEDLLLGSSLVLRLRPNDGRESVEGRGISLDSFGMAFFMLTGGYARVFSGRTAVLSCCDWRRVELDRPKSLELMLSRVLVRLCPLVGRSAS